MSGVVQHHRGSDEFTESSPLLRDERPRRPSHRPTLSVASIASVHVPKVHNGWTIVNFLCVIAFLASSSAGFIGIPVTAVVEDIICRQYYGVKEDANNLINEERCKDDSIQSKVAFIMALTSSFDAVVGFLSAFPWGLVADRIGRKPVFVIALFGMILNISWIITVLNFHTALPVELIWLGSLGYTVGGGSAVLVGIILSMIADSTTEEERAVAFMRLHVSSLAGNLISPGVSSFMMENMGPWPPIWSAIFVIVAAAAAFLFVPETLKHQKDREEDTQEPETEVTGPKSRVAHVIARFKESLSILKSTSLILLLLTSLGSAPVLYSTLGFMAQFISKRYDIELSKTGYVQSTYGIAQVIQALLFLPWITRYIMRDTTPAIIRAPDEHYRDLSLARCSFGVLVVGILILGLSPNLACFIMGLLLMALAGSFNSLTRSLLTLYIDPEHRSRLFSLVGMVEVVGSVYAQPLLATLFALGMKLGGGWIGLPYYGVSVIVAIAGSLLYFVRMPEETKHLSSAQEDGQHQD
ncbi:MFS general substrate transporter [Annulohypoxylon maeteangense]|uniref:MFS general substrate transporter n=1 Tax=Annulohypoxylon maeteangense TaxID=1927788 RepID=UPI0020078BBB|nr:MFS general substrate transporter [Annulohypoxylon maeteangense]KAI0882229.1 MFS general substrate transporter [Annulohypoxylon maeteangense]